MKSSKMTEAVHTHTHTHTGNQINEELNKSHVGADASVRPEHKGNTQKGITLLALIITIIVLLILSVVSVQLITKSGIIEKAKQGVIKHKLEEIHENVKLSYTSLKLGNNLSVITMSDEIKKLQENKYKKYIEKVNYTSTKVFYKMTDKLDGKEYMIDIKTGEIGVYEDKLQRVEADDTLWDLEESTNTIRGYFGTGDLLKNVTVPNVIKKKDGTEVKITNVSLSNINFEGTLTFASGLTLRVGTINNCDTVENILIGDNVTIQGRGNARAPFNNCNNIRSVTMGRNINMDTGGEKDNAPFYNSKVEKLTIESLSKVGNYAFYGVRAALQGDIVINEGVTQLANCAFKDCSNITSVSIPSTVTQIGESVFENCTNLKTAKLPEGIKTIGNNAFYNCTNLSDEITIKEGTTLGQIAFNKTNITKVTVENGVTIPIGSFDYCPKLKNIIIGDNVTIQTKGNALAPFSYCENIQNVTMGKDIKMNTTGGKEWAPFINSKVEKLTVESLSEVGNYAFYGVGVALQGDIVINEGVTQIGNWAFKDCSNITSVSIPSTVTKIGESVFENCTNLKTAKLPEGIKTIGNNAFYNCTNLSDEITIKEGTTLGQIAFNKTNITKVTVENGVTIPIGSFDYCPKLKNIIIGDNVTIQTKGNALAPFSYCENIQNVTMGKDIKMNTTGGKEWAPFINSKVEKLTVESLSEVGNYAFYGVGVALQGDIVINEGVTQIGNWAFKDCSNITSVSIPSTVTEIKSKAFENCKALKTININMTEEEWNKVTKGSNWNTNVTANIVFKK